MIKQFCITVLTLYLSACSHQSLELDAPENDSISDSNFDVIDKLKKDQRQYSKLVKTGRNFVIDKQDCHFFSDTKAIDNFLSRQSVNVKRKFFNKNLKDIEEFKKNITESKFNTPNDSSMEQKVKESLSDFAKLDQSKIKADFEKNFGRKLNNNTIHLITDAFKKPIIVEPIYDVVEQRPTTVFCNGKIVSIPKPPLQIRRRKL